MSDTIWNSGLIKGEAWQPQFINFTSPIEEGFLVFEHRPAVDSVNYINFSNLQIDGVSGPFQGYFSQPDIGESAED